MRCWRRMEKMKWSEKVNNEVLECMREKSTLLNNVLCRKSNWIGNFLRINCLLHDAIEGQTISERSRKKCNTTPL
jgi:hypothetical protein